MAPKIQFSGDSILIKADDKASKVHSKKAGTIYQLSDCTIAHITGQVSAREIKEYKADVLILQHEQSEKIIAKLKPKLAILTNASLEKTRELHKKTGVQIITAKGNPTIDLFDYAALSEQKALSKFTGNT